MRKIRSADTQTELDAGDLARLIETEKRLDAMLAKAPCEAERLIDDARVASRAEARRLEADLERTAAVRRAEIEAERLQAKSAIQRRAARDAAGFATVSDARVGELATYVIRRAMAGRDARDAS